MEKLLNLLPQTGLGAFICAVLLVLYDLIRRYPSMRNAYRKKMPYDQMNDADKRYDPLMAEGVMEHKLAWTFKEIFGVYLEADKRRMFLELKRLFGKELTFNAMRRLYSYMQFDKKVIYLRFNQVDKIAYYLVEIFRGILSGMILLFWGVGAFFLFSDINFAFESMLMSIPFIYLFIVISLQQAPARLAKRWKGCINAYSIAHDRSSDETAVHPSGWSNVTGSVKNRKTTISEKQSVDC